MISPTEGSVLSYAEISDKLKALDASLAEAEAEFDLQAGDAVAGVPGAGKLASDTNARIDRLNLERKILVSALANAEAREAAIAAAAAADDRARHLNKARLNALTLLDKAGRVDTLIESLKSALAELDVAEGAVWCELRLAGKTPPGSLIGRNGLSGDALIKIEAFVRDKDRFLSHDRSIKEKAGVGWAFLIEVDEENEGVS